MTSDNVRQIECWFSQVIYPSPCNPAPNVTMSSGRSVVRDRYFLDPHSAVSYGSCPPYMRALRCTLEWDIIPTHAIKASELDQGRSALPSRAKQEPPHAL